AVALERTASGCSAPSAFHAAVTARSTSSGMARRSSAARIDSAAARAASTEVPSNRSSSPNRASASGSEARKSSNARVVTQNPGGTVTPARASLARFAPFPPTRGRSSGPTSENLRVSTARSISFPVSNGGQLELVKTYRIGKHVDFDNPSAHDSEGEHRGQPPIWRDDQSHRSVHERRPRERGRTRREHKSPLGDITRTPELNRLRSHHRIRIEHSHERSEHTIGHGSEVLPILLEALAQPVAFVHGHLSLSPVVKGLTNDLLMR